MRSRTTVTTIGAVAAASLLGACSVASTGEEEATGRELTVVTHDSFALPEELLTQFEADTGNTVTVVQPGDAGALVNQLVLTKDSPLGDVVYGIDNAFATRAVDEDVLAPYRSPALPTAAEDYLVGDGDHLTPVDMGDVCLNIDRQWYAERAIPEPATLEDLTRPEYADQLVVTNPATSSPGLAFLLATVGAFGADGWADYWRQLADNGVSVVDGWSDAYYVDFSGTGEGTRPLVVSYSSSPAAEELAEGEEPRTAALPGTCFRQVEYAGVLDGADNAEGAEAFIDFLLSADVQAALPESMYMYPVDPDIELPAAWAANAPLSSDPHEVDPADIAANREEWVRTWTEIVLG